MPIPTIKKPVTYKAESFNKKIDQMKKEQKRL